MIPGVGASLFALGAERSADTLQLVSALKRAEPGCDRAGNLPAAHRGEVGKLVELLEERLA